MKCDDLLRLKLSPGEFQIVAAEHNSIVAALSAQNAQMREALASIDRLECKCSDAWCGVESDASLLDLGEIGGIARRTLALPVLPSAGVQAAKDKVVEAAIKYREMSRQFVMRENEVTINQVHSAELAEYDALDALAELRAALEKI